MIKTITEYQELAKRTCNDLGNYPDNYMHMKLGVITEIGELLDVFKKHIGYKKPIDVVNVGEEICDILFYVCNRLTFNTQQVSEMHLNTFYEGLKGEINTIDDVINLCLEILDTEVISNNKTPRFIVVIPEYKIAAFRRIAEYFELDFMQILTNNIDKLKVRYPDKFDTDKAINRNLDRERIELEK